MSDITISLLPVSLALVHIPRSRLATLTQHVLRPILRPNPGFLNVTCNEIELSLFAEDYVLEEFEKIARKDARKLRRRREAQKSNPHSQTAHRRRRKEDWEPIDVSSDRWSVVQIDSHADSLDNSGARVRELSAPLAAAGISILYQSSYMSDFIFVKSSRLSQVMSLFAVAGFEIYSSNPDNLTAQLSTFTSPSLSPTRDDASSISVLDLNSLSITSSSSRVDPGGGAVLTRSRSSTDATSSSSGSHGSSILQMSSPLDFCTGPAHSSTTLGSLASTGAETEEGEVSDTLLTRTPAPGPARRPAMSRSQSHSPSGCDVSVLIPDLTYVGLSDEHAETWACKVVKLVAFPDLIVGAGSAHSRSSSASARSGSPASPFVFEPVALDASVSIAGAVCRMGNGSGSDITTRVGSDPVKEVIELYENATDSMPWEGSDAESSDEDGYFSSDRVLREPDITPDARLALLHHDTINSLTASDTTNPSAPSPPSRPRSDSASSTSTSSVDSSTSPLVPFFSFTRTGEGSSLTAPVSLLAALFPPNERHMVICSDELDILDSRHASPVRAEEENESEDGETAPQGPLKCLQIDLRKFGLDKHGLVNRFSRTLEENGINHMYNSTFKTANLLVDRAHATRAQALLRSC